MDRIVIAVSNDTLRESVSAMIRKNGLFLRASVSNGAAAIREMRLMEGGILICSPRLPDTTSDQMARALEESVYFLVIGRPDDLSHCRNEDCFKLPLPVNASGLLGSVRILQQLDERRQAAMRRASRRSGEDKRLIREAKAYLMEARGMSEDQAHRFLQKQSMDTATPVAEIARMIVANE